MRTDALLARPRKAAQTALVVAIALTLAGCASAPRAASPLATTPPPEECVDVAPLGCSSFRSEGGGDAAGELPWLNTEPLGISVSRMNETPTLVVDTPCNTLNVPVTLEPARITGDTDALVSTTKACLGPHGDAEAWTRRLLSAPIDVSVDGVRLTLHNAHGAVEFVESGSRDAVTPP